ncbi:MAG: hypothetical protein ABSG37_09050 [Candidatus Limnocylindrales bacterium]
MAWFQKNGRENSTKTNIYIFGAAALIFAFLPGLAYGDLILAIFIWLLWIALFVFNLIVARRTPVGQIAILPATLSCSSTQWTKRRAIVRLKLPKTLKGSDGVTVMLDGLPAGNLPTSKFFHFFDGTWLYDNNVTVASVCSGVNGDREPALGTHEMQLLDSMGNVLAVGSYTITP